MGTRVSLRQKSLRLSNFKSSRQSLLHIFTFSPSFSKISPSLCGENPPIIKKQERKTLRLVKKSNIKVTTLNIFHYGYLWVVPRAEFLGDTIFSPVSPLSAVLAVFATSKFSSHTVWSNSYFLCFCGAQWFGGLSCTYIPCIVNLWGEREDVCCVPQEVEETWVLERIYCKNVDRRVLLLKILKNWREHPFWILVFREFFESVNLHGGEVSDGECVFFGQKWPRKDFCRWVFALPLFDAGNVSPHILL